MKHTYNSVVRRRLVKLKFTVLREKKVSKKYIYTAMRLQTIHHYINLIIKVFFIDVVLFHINRLRKTLILNESGLFN